VIGIRPTSSRSVKLRSGLHGLVPLLSELILELLFLGGSSLTDLLELLLKVDNSLFLLRRMLQ
jgi:hypothetical protein